VLLAVLVTAMLAGCAQQSEESPLMSLRRDLPEDTTLLMPAAEPPDLVDAALSSADGTTIASFYSRNQPIVSICQAAVEVCHRLLPTSEVIALKDPHPGATVMIEAQEDGVNLTLSDALRRFWTEVDLMTGRPAWLGSR
jgi:hypothetical protein